MKHKFVFLSVVVVLALSMLACGIGEKTPTAAPPTEAPVKTEAPTQPPVKTEPPTQGGTGELMVFSAYGYKDSWDYYHVTGLVKNDSNKAVSSIELEIQMRDASGNTVLKDYDGNAVESATFNPMLNTLLPGETAPFDYILYGTDMVPDTFEVAISGSLSGSATRPGVEVRNAQLITGDNGSYTIVGELVNNSPTSAKINDLAGAMLDDSGNVVAADYAYDMCNVLYPSGVESDLDYAPFAITLDAEEGANFTNWQVYIDADEYASDDPIPLFFEFSTPYFDDYGTFHIVGTYENQGSDTYYTSLLAGLYNEQGLVVDASNASFPLYLKPGDVIPFDISLWNVVNYDDDLAATVTRYTVQSDPYWTYTVDYDLVELTNVTLTKDERSSGQISLGGDLVNDSGKELYNATVLGYLTDASGNLVAVATAYVFPDGDSIAAGDTNDFEMTFWLDPTIDADSLTVNFMIQGDIK
ncbi:MAG TPA: hypothetical protein PKG95_04030 [Anaerolineaceae bacterium]|nr:hypothetical protein [Anaerolineaceae bacterium]